MIFLHLPLVTRFRRVLACGFAVIAVISCGPREGGNQESTAKTSPQTALAAAADEKFEHVDSEALGINITWEISNLNEGYLLRGGKMTQTYSDASKAQGTITSFKVHNTTIKLLSNKAVSDGKRLVIQTKDYGKVLFKPGGPMVPDDVWLKPTQRKLFEQIR